MRVRLVLPLVAIAFAAACGSDNSTGPKPPDHFSSITVSDSGFAPESLDVQLNTLVTWNVTSGTLHHVIRFVGASIPEGSTPSSDLQNGENASTTFITAGTYHYDDSLHTGLTGLVYVH
jgi:plastocyanin